MCHYGKVCKNLQWLKIHQAKTRCGSGKRQKERTVITDKKEENHSRDEHHSVEGLLPPEATQINTEEEESYSNQRRTTVEPSSDNRKQRIQWPPSDDKRWESFDEDLDKILGSTLMADVHGKLSSLSTFVYTVGQERFGLVKTRDGKEADIINKPNRRQLEIQKLRTEINFINKRYRKASDEENEGLRQLRFTLREKRNHLQKAERIEKSRKERSRKRVCSQSIQVYKNNT